MVIIFFHRVWLDSLDQLGVMVSQEGRVYLDLLGQLENLAKMALRVSGDSQERRDSKETREIMDHPEQQVSYPVAICKKVKVNENEI